MRTGQRRRLVAATALTGAAGAAALTGGAALAQEASAEREADLQTAHSASAKYHSVEQAIADGYRPTQHCDELEDVGAMGYHWAKPENFGSTDPSVPAVLLYAPDGNGGVKLAGVEWVVPDRDQKLKTDKDRPYMFDGVAFQGPMPGHFPGMPVHYDLHVWLWEDNPRGLFEPWNSGFSCPSS